MLFYLYLFLATIAVDLLPFFGPPAWIVMVFFQVHYGLNIWYVLLLGVSGSTIGRYLLSRYIPLLSGRLITKEKNEDLAYVGAQLSKAGWKMQLFVLLYTLVPLPSTPLFTASGIARVKAIYILPAFFIGKFSSDMAMVLTGDYVTRNAETLSTGQLSWQNIAGSLAGIIIIALFLFIDWRVLLQNRKLTLNFNIWK